VEVGLRIEVVRLPTAGLGTDDSTAASMEASEEPVRGQDAQPGWRNAARQRGRSPHATAMDGPKRAGDASQTLNGKQPIAVM
jgi:hypothetical protein